MKQVLCSYTSTSRLMVITSKLAYMHPATPKDPSVTEEVFELEDPKYSLHKIYIGGSGLSSLCVQPITYIGGSGLSHLCVQPMILYKEDLDYPYISVMPLRLCPLSPEDPQNTTLAGSGGCLK